MDDFELTHLANHVLRQELVAAGGARAAIDAHELARVAEFDARKLYLPEGYPSMRQFCVAELKYTRDEAHFRIRVARIAHEFPAIFPMIRDRQLSQTVAVRLAPRLTEQNAAELLAAAANQTIEELEVMLAARFPRPDVPTLVMAIEPAAVGGDPGAVGVDRIQVVSKPPAHATPRAKETPLAPQRFALQVTIGQGTHNKLRRAKELLAHTVRSGDVAEVLDRALDALIEKLERRRCGATDRPRPRRGAAKGRHIPAAVKREVARRDGDQCAFMSESGHRCEERGYMEFDHVIPVARGGRSTVENVRQRCHAHNQHAADLVYGRGFMDEKRREAQRQAAEAKAQKTAADAARARERAAAEAELAAASDVIPALKILGWRGDDLRFAAKLCAAMPNATTKERVHHCIKALGRARMSQLTRGTRSPG